MSKNVVYWAEKHLAQAYHAPDRKWIWRSHTYGLLISGAAAYAITATVFLGYEYLSFNPSPEVTVITLDIPLPVVSRTPSIVVSPAPATTTIARTPVTTLSRKPIQDRSGIVRPDATTRTLLAAAKPSLSPKSPPTKDMPPAALHAAPVSAATEVKPEAGSRGNVDKRPDKKPVDIAPAEKLGIRDVAADSITLTNGARIKLGARLPNGELLQGLDAARGMIETDRRIMMVTP